MPVSAFIIRPFGKKDVVMLKEPPPADKLKPATPREAKAEVVQIDFDQIHRHLIAPALRHLRIEANTTEVVLASGNIREDMFHLLMTADLVVADVSILNPNVYYELGIRHAFRDKFTFLIRSNLSDVPFDLRTDRYFEYDHTILQDGDDHDKAKLDQREKSVAALAKAVRATLNSERSDSPVFRLLPRMRAEDRSRFIAAPREFKEELERAKKYRRGGDLRLLAAECEGFLWEIEGLREVGRAQFELNFIGGACATFEEIVRRYPDDVEANMVLSTVYQRRNDSARSEQALARVARQQFGDVNTKAEIQSLIGRNLRARWQESWDGRHVNLTPVQRQKRALQSPFLRRAYDAYAASFRGNLNYVYSGVNALALLLIELSLGDIHDAEWKVVSSGYDARVERRKEAERLTAVLGYAIDCERQRLEGENQIDFWFYSLRATFLVLTSDDPRKVAQAYREAVAYAPKYTEESMRRGLDMYQTLEADHFNPAINTQENINAALDVISGEEGQRTARNVLLFAGLRMPPLNGSHDNQVMRYLPAAAEDWAREKIIECVQSEQDKLKAKAQARTPPPVSKSQREASLEQEVGDQHDSQRLGRLNRELTRLRDMRLREERARATDPELVGMAAGSSGGDILFHEVCHDLKVATQMYMALPRDQYVGKYVSEAGPRWVERFHAVHTRLKNARPDASEVEAAIQILADTDELPRWLQSLDNYSIGRRTEVWMLQHALVQRSIYGPDTEVTLVVLWAEKRAIAGGLNLLIDLAARNGVKVLTIDCSEWDREGPPVAAAAAAAGADSGGARVTPR